MFSRIFLDSRHQLIAVEERLLLSWKGSIDLEVRRAAD
jgi:hypothetical protein